MTPSLIKAAATARTWLLEAMAPLWTAAGFDASTGQFVEALSQAGEPLPLPRRSLVQARQMVVCCAAGRLGWDGPWRERTSAAGEALLARGRNPASDWIYSFKPDGAPADTRGDLYTQAFVVLGLAEAGRALGRADFIAAARATCDRLDAVWVDPTGGYRDGEIAPHPGRQNPHMHLLEAFLALYAATQDAADLRRAEQIGELFMCRLFMAPGQIPESFNTDWRPIPAAGAAPGHQFEWSWLLGVLHRSGGLDRSRAAAALAAYGERCGVDAAGFTMDEIRLDGAPKTPSARLWPQAERLKAALARLDQDPAAPAAAEQAVVALSAFLATPVAGAWRDLRLANGDWQRAPAPASSAYHIIGALEPLITRAGRRA